MSFSQQAPLDVLASVAAKRRALVVDDETKLRDEGWEFVDTTTHKLVLLDDVNTVQTGATLMFPRNVSRFDIFLAFFSPNLVSRVIEKRTEENPDVLVENAGGGRYRKLTLTPTVVYQYFTCQILIHGSCCQPGKSQHDTMKSARDILER